MQSNKGIYILLIIILVIVALTSGVTLLRSVLPGGGSAAAPLGGNDSFFDMQNAMVMGKITKVGDNTITVENKKGVTRELPVSKTVSVQTQTSLAPGAIATPSADLKQIEIGKEYNVSLGVMLAGPDSSSGALEVMSIFPGISAPVVGGGNTPPPPPGEPAPLPSGAPRAPTNAAPPTGSAPPVTATTRPVASENPQPDEN